MIALVLTLALAQGIDCRGEASAAMAEATDRIDRFDLAGAADAYEAASTAGCSDAEVAASYLRGLVAAREAYLLGGTPESLEPVWRAAASLEARAGGRPGAAAIAHAVLRAAAAAAQSERGEMAVYLEHAVATEALQFLAGEPGAPVITAHEAAGELWWQVHQYDEARGAYRLAAERWGRTPRVMLGLARAADKSSDEATACAEYAALIGWWGTRPAAPAPIEEARAYVLQTRGCR